MHVLFYFKYCADDALCSLFALKIHRYIIFTATAKIAEELAGDPAANEEGASELLKPYKEAAALLSAWNALASSADITTGFMALQGHVLPPPLPVVNLFYAVCALVGFASTDLQNACEDPDWTAIRKVRFFLLLPLCGVKRYIDESLEQFYELTVISTISRRIKL